MDQVLQDSTALDSVLLAEDEAQYDKLALGIVAKLNKLSAQDLAASKEDLDVRALQNQPS